MVTRLWKGEKFVVTNGNPEANASKIDIDIPSENDGITNNADFFK